jgi:hypothetical protein
MSAFDNYDYDPRLSEDVADAIEEHPEAERSLRCEKCRSELRMEERRGSLLVSCEYDPRHWIGRNWRKLIPKDVAVTVTAKCYLDPTGPPIGMLQRALSALQKSEGLYPATFQRGDRLVSVDSAGGVRPLNATQLRMRLEGAISWAVSGGNAYDPPRNVDPPAAVATNLLKMGDWSPTIPQLDAVVTVPTVRRDGSIWARPGYDQVTRTFLVLDEEIDLLPPEAVSEADVRQALDLLTVDLLGDFPFVSDADRANALGLLLLPFVRDLIQGPTPLHWIGAPEPGTGKGKLVDCLLAAGCGVVPSRPFDASESERRKMLSTVFRSGAAACKLDNVRGVVRSMSLEAALTEAVWSDRLLGGNATFEAPIRTIWVLTANNASAGTDMARRVVPISLDAGCEFPGQRTGPESGRTWRHRQPEWAHEHRHQLIRAALTLCRWWVQDGMPLDEDIAFGSFESYAALIGGVLASVGIAGFLENLATVENSDGERETTTALFRAWFEVYGDQPISSGGLLADGRLAAYMPRMDSAHAVGRFLGERCDQVRDGLILSRHRTSTLRGWRVSRV